MRPRPPPPLPPLGNHWTRRSCHRFRANEVRLQLSVLAYNLGNLWRRLFGSMHRHEISVADVDSRRRMSHTLATLRRLLLGILLLGLVGTATELLLIGHDEDAWQMIPLVVLAMAMLASLGMAATRFTSATGATSVTGLFRAAMVLLMLSGAMGSVLHYRANMEFKREMDPSLSGFALFSSVVQAQAPPALAPGTLALLGLLGLACAFRLDVRTP